MKRGGAVCGAVSLTVIFCTLCMAVFAALTFVTANRERVFAELDAQRTAEFYRADRDATRIAAALRDGDFDAASAILAASDAPQTLNLDDGAEFPQTLNLDDGAELPQTLNLDDNAEFSQTSGAGGGIVRTESDGGTLAEFSVPAGGQQRLDVRLLLRDGDAQILQWKKVYAGEWQNDDSMTLADIDDIISLAEID